MDSAVSAGDIVRTQWPLRMSDHLNLYLGSGRCGACFDAYGLMHNAYRGTPRSSQSNTTLMHADHWHRGAYGLDYWLPVARLVWAGDPPPPPTAYRQELRIHDGLLSTFLAWPTVRVSFQTHFHPECRDLLAVHVSYEATGDGEMPWLLLAPETHVKTHYDQELSGDAETLELDVESGWWLGRVAVGSAESVVGLRVISTEGTAELKTGPRGLSIGFGGERGRHLLLIGCAGASRKAELCADMAAVDVPEQFAAEARQAWHRRWGTGRIEVPVPEYQTLWARSLYYTLCSYAPDVRSPAAPMGWSGNGWPFHFPQDVSYIHPALLRLGHHDIARSWVDFYRDRLETMQDYTARVYGAEGAMWAWEFPIGPDSQLLSGEYPNWCQFEIHNAAYPARMAREASLHLGDAEWTRETAWPVVRESARFLGSVLERDEGGTWGIHVEPSFGQDEMGGHNAKNYLCALFSAQYALQAALAMAAELGAEDPALERWRSILADGLAFERLRGDDGLLVTCEGLLGAEQVGKEKHPVQLNPLIFLPLVERPDHVVRAYERRYDLCAGVRENRYHGWTLAAYWLAASHMGDADGLLAELGQAQPGRYVDPAWIQIYETSGSIHSPFYVTSHGLYLQALTDALVSDYWGETQIGAACPEDWAAAAFSGLRTADGAIHTGRRCGAGWEHRAENGTA